MTTQTRPNLSATDATEQFALECLSRVEVIDGRDHDLTDAEVVAEAVRRVESIEAFGGACREYSREGGES